ALTSGSLAALDTASGDPAHSTELAVLVAANLAATVLRFLLFRAWVFPDRASDTGSRQPGATPEQDATAPGPSGASPTTQTETWRGATSPSPSGQEASWTTSETGPAPWARPTPQPDPQVTPSPAPARAPRHARHTDHDPRTTR
ncbi:glycosyl transferase, partial [Streptomyces sp. NPDC057062]